MISTQDARTWLERWDRQQEVYIADREERFAVIADVVATVGDTPTVVDLGCGPGSLSARLLDRLPGAQVIGVDADPLLLGIGRAGYADRPGLRLVPADLRTPGWARRLGIQRADAVVSTTALHWLDRDELGAVYREAGELLRWGGVLVDGDHMQREQRGLAAIEHAVRDGRANRVGRRGESWGDWWEAVAAAPELAELTGERGARPLEHTVPDEPSLGLHTELLAAAGFVEVGTVWQHGDDRVLVGVR